MFLFFGLRLVEIYTVKSVFINIESIIKLRIEFVNDGGYIDWSQFFEADV